MKVGFVCGAFDLLHAGHVHLLKECKKYCDYLIVGLQVDPSVDRKEKNKPIQSVIEREIQLGGCRYVDNVFVYERDWDLYLMIINLDIDIRFLGSDYVGSKEIVYEDLVPIKYIQSIPIHTSDIRKRK